MTAVPKNGRKNKLCNVSGKVYLSPRPRNVEELKAKIRAVWDSVTPEKLRSLGPAWVRRLRMCIARGGRIFEK